MIDVLIPVKKHSRRIPNKNFRMLGDKPLYRYILDTLEASKYISDVYIDTDYREGLDVSSGIIIDRPRHLCGDIVSVNKLIEYDLSKMKSDIILQTHVTNPFLSTKTIDKCIEYFVRNNLDSLFTVTEHYERFWTKEGVPVNHDPGKLKRTQELSPLLSDNSCIYLFTRQFFDRNKSRVNTDSDMYIIPEGEALDIDTMFNWRVAECLVRQ